MTTYLRFLTRLFPASWWTCWYWTWGRSGGGRDVGSAGASGNGASDSTFRWGVTVGSTVAPVVGLFSPPWQRRSRWTWRSSWAVEWRDRRGWGRLGLGLQSSYTVPSKKPWPCWGRWADWPALGSSASWGGGRASDCPRSPVPPERTSCSQTWSSGLLWSRESPPQGTDRTRCSPTWTRTAWRSGRRSCHGRGESWRRRRSSAWGQPALGGSCCCRPVLGGARPVPPLPLYLADADVDVSSARLARQDCPPLSPVLPGWGRRASHRLCLSGPPLHQKTCRDPRPPSRRLPAQPTPPPPPPHATALPQLQICNCINHKHVYTTIVFFHQVCHHCLSVWSSTVPFCT